MRPVFALCALAALTVSSLAPRGAAANPGRNPESVSLQAPQDVPRLLSQLGYAPVRESDGQYHVVIDRGGYTIFVRVALSGDRSEVWLAAKLGKVDTDNLPARTYRELLGRNTGTAHFDLCNCADCKGAVKDLCICQPTSNRSLTRARLRQELDGFCNTVVRLAATWEPAMHAQSTASAKPSISGKPFVSSGPRFPARHFTEPYTLPGAWANPRPFTAPKSFTSILNGR